MASVFLIASISCAGGPTSDYPLDPVRTLDSGTGAKDDDGAEPNGGTTDAAVSGGADAGEPSGAMDAGAIGSEPPCVLDAGADADAADTDASDGSVNDASDAAGDASDAATDAGDAAQIEAGANFPDAANDAEAAVADASSDAPYTLPDGAACVP